MSARRDVIRRARFQVPHYGRSVCVNVTLSASGGMDRRGQTLMRVRFTCPAIARSRVWEADGFAGSPLHADDSAETLASAVNLALECARQDGTLPAWLAGMQETLEWMAQERAGVRP